MTLVMKMDLKLNQTETNMIKKSVHRFWKTVQLKCNHM